MESTSRFLQTYPFWGAFLINFLLFFILYVFFQPQFLTPDDPEMLFSVAGVLWVPAPTPYMLYTHTAIGYLLVQLYAWALHIPWYTLYLMFGLWLGHTGILYLILKKNTPPTAVWGYLLLCVLLSTYLLLHLQFTITAAVCCVAGCMLVTDAMASGKGVRLQAVAGILLLLLGSMIRWYAFLLMLIIYTPFILDRLRTCPGSRWKNWLLVWAGILLCCFFMHRMDQEAYQTAGWTDFQSFNGLRAQFVDYLAGERIPDRQERVMVLEAHGWSENDYLMLREWFFVDSNLYNIPQFEQVLADLPHTNSKISLWIGIKTVAYHWLTWPGVAYLGFLAVMLLLFRIPRMLWIHLGIVLGGTSLLLMLLAWRFYQPPERVYLPMFFAIASLFFAIAWDWKLRWPFTTQRKHMLLLTVLAVAILCTGVMACRASATAQEQHRQLQQILVYLRANSGQVYLVWGAGFPRKYLNPWSSMEAWQDIRHLAIGPAQQTPLMHAQMEAMGIEHVYQFIATDPRARLMVHGDKREVPTYFRTFMKEHYEMEIDMVLTDSLPRTLIFRTIQKNKQ